MRAFFGFVGTLFLVGMMGCGGENQTAGGNQSGGLGGALQVPAAPAALTASAGNAQITLNWGASANASGYHVKRGQASGGPYAQLASSSTASYTDGSVSSGTTYYYVVSAWNSAGESANSNEAKATLVHSPTTYYVSPTGSDSSPGTQAQPFATVQNGVNQLSAGDTLILRAGNYREFVTVARSGSAGSPITLAAYPGETPTLIGAQPHWAVDGLQRFHLHGAMAHTADAGLLRWASAERGALAEFGYRRPCGDDLCDRRRGRLHLADQGQSAARGSDRRVDSRYGRTGMGGL